MSAGLQMMMKAMGIDPAKMLSDVMPDIQNVISDVTNAAESIKQIHDRQCRIEENISLIMAHLCIDNVQDKADVSDSFDGLSNAEHHLLLTHN